jgi:predicted N-acetyltransferase YhbS
MTAPSPPPNSAPYWKFRASIAQLQTYPALQAMLDHADILWTAWDGATLVGVARALTDFSYACYLSDLAVAKAQQAQGIGKTLIDHLAQQIGPEVSLVLLAAPSALDYYPKVGFNKAENAFIKPRKPF